MYTGTPSTLLTLMFRNIINTLDQTGRADEISLARVFDVSAARVRVVLSNRLHHVSERESVGHELGSIRIDVVLLFIPADAVDFGDASDGAKLRADDPILDGP